MSAIALKISTASALSLLMLVADAASAQEFQAALQVSPPGGGHCIEVPGGAFVQDQGLQMMDCTGTAAQLFSYDPTRMRLAIGGLCIDANGGKPGDLVKLSTCDGGAGQTWQAKQKARRRRRPLPRYPLRLDREGRALAELDLRRGRAEPAVAPATKVAADRERSSRMRKCVASSRGRSRAGRRGSGTGSRCWWRSGRHRLGTP